MDHQVEWQGRIVCDPHVLRGKPTIKGTRLPVTLVLNLLEHGYSFERIVQAYPELSEDDIRAALAYAQARLASEETILLAS